MSFIERAAFLKAEKALGKVDLPEWSEFDLQDFRNSIREEFAQALATTGTRPALKVSVSLPPSISPLLAPATKQGLRNGNATVPPHVINEVQELCIRELENEGFSDPRVCVTPRWGANAISYIQMRQNRVKFLDGLVGVAYYLTLLMFCVLGYYGAQEMSALTILTLAIPYGLVGVCLSGLPASIVEGLTTKAIDNLTDNFVIESADLDIDLNVILDPVDLTRFQARVDKRAKELLVDESSISTMSVAREIEQLEEELINAV
jgi:hypothetical protein